MPSYFAKLDALARNVLFPIVSTGMVLYSNEQGQPWDVQYIAGWITTSVFHASNQRLLKFFLSSGLCLVYVEDFIFSMNMVLNPMYRAHITDGSLQVMPRLTWMQSLNVCGS